MLLAFAFNIDENIIKVYYHKNVELLHQDLIDIALEYSRYIDQSKKHDLVFEVTIVDLEGRLPFIAFSDLYSMVDIGQLELGEMPNPT